jgi:hypothetical protein
MYQDPAGELTNEDAFNYNASTNTLAVENITGTTVTGTGVVKGSNTFGQRYATQAATNRAAADTASLTVERYFTVTAEGNGESFNIQSNTPSAGNKIVRKIWYKDEAFEATDVDTWTLLHTFADDTAYASTATKWQEYLDGQANGTPPFTLAISWEDVTIPVGILDGYTTDLSGAFATALLDENYTGNCVKVRRASDNTEQDIGFDGADLDTAALTTFCTGTDCFVRTWYDQSGNANNLTQTTTGNQPKIYDASTGVLELGSAGFEKPALLVNSKWFDWTTPVSFTNLTFFTVTKKASTAGTGSVIFYQSSGAYGGDDVDNQGNPRLGTTSGVIIGNSLSNTTTSGAENTHHISYYHRNGTSADGGLNGEVKTPASPVNTTAFTVNDIFNYGGTYTYDGQAQAIIMYNASKSSDRAAIETALNDYFNVY